MLLLVEASVVDELDADWVVVPGPVDAPVSPSLSQPTRLSPKERPMTAAALAVREGALQWGHTVSAATTN